MPATLGTKMRENDPCLYLSAPSKKQCFIEHGLKVFLAGSLNDADQAPLKNQPQTLIMSATRPKPCKYGMFCEAFPQNRKPELVLQRCRI